MKRFGGDRIKTVMNWVGMDENTPIENGMVSKAIENSQIKVEGFHFDIRKHLVEFDDVVNKQREIIYAERRKVLSGADLKANILEMVGQEIKSFISERIGNRTADLWDLDGLLSDINGILPLPKDVTAASLADLDPAAIQNRLADIARQAYDLKEQQTGAGEMRRLERLVMIKVIDELWVEHLTNMENQRQQASFAGLQQMKAEDAYKRIGGEQWEILKTTIREEVARLIFHVSIRKEESREVSTPISKAAGKPNQSSSQAPHVAGKKIGRNDPCFCGSGKKYKHCHGK
jgi:preprotein translocase subunit SecA